MSEMNLKKLTEPLKREHIEFRVANAFESRGAVWCNILAYKDARTDMEILDQAVGQMNWQNKYDRDSKGVLQCGIGIYSTLEPSKWVWKWSNGVPSDFESAKGEYSDAFKRAGFMWGIGRQLYDFPQIFIQLIEGDYFKKDGRIKVAARFRPNDWQWNISEDYKTVTARRKVAGSLKEVFNSNPYKK